MPSQPPAPSTAYSAHPPAGVHSLWRLRRYLRPHLPAMIGMLVAALAGVGLSIAIPLVIKAMIDGPITHHDASAIVPLGLLALGFGVLEAVLVWTRRWVQSNAVLGVETALRSDLYERLQQLPMAFHGHWQSGQLLSRATTDLSSIRRFSGFGLIFLIINITQLTVVTLVLLLGALAVGRGSVSLGTLVAFITLMLSLVWPVASLGVILAMAQEAMTASARILEIFDTEPAIVSGTAVLAEPRGHLRLEGVGFSYPGHGDAVLHDVDLDVAPGETVALVGATGSGKTTLTALVPRLYDVTAGRVTVDGVDVRDLELTNLRQIVATAFEEPTLFSMSARENLLLGRADASDEDIAEALEVAQAGFVHDLPWGLDTRIGEQGMALSGGQRQRLALARAVLARPKILVLDDTLSALDVHTEKLVEEALRRVLANATGIVVAHRASTVLLADKVALLQGGTITHVGEHSHLLATVPAYRDLLAADAEEELAELVEDEEVRA